MKTIAKIQPALRRHLANVSFQARKSTLLSRMERMGVSVDTQFVTASLVNARNNAGLLSAIGAHFNELTQSGVVDQQLVESFPARLRNAARIYTSGQHMFAAGRVCVMGNASVTAIGSMAHVKASGNTTVILEGATASVAEGVFVMAHSGARVRRITPNSL